MRPDTIIDAILATIPAAIVASVLLAAGFCPPALAQRVATDAQVMAACLKKENDTGAFGSACIGAAADPCISDAMKQKTYWEDSKACAGKELAVWTDLMAKALQQITKHADKTVSAAVVESQKAWQQSREKLCPIFDGLDPGMVPGGSSYCRLQETARRVLSLQRMGAALAPH